MNKISVSKADLSKYNMIAITVFTEAYIGQEGLMLKASDKDYHENLLLKYFDGMACPSLAGKVKWVNIITSQKVIDLTLNEKKRTVADGYDSHQVLFLIPVQSNFIIFYSTIEGQKQRFHSN